MRKQHLLNGDDDVVCGTRHAQSFTHAYNDVTCHRCRATVYWHASAEAHRNPRDEVYERAAARFTGEGRDWR